MAVIKKVKQPMHLWQFLLAILELIFDQTILDNL